MENLQDATAASKKMEDAIKAGYIYLDEQQRARWLLSIVRAEDPFEAILYAYNNEDSSKPKFFMPFMSFVEGLVGQLDSTVASSAREAALSMLDSALADMVRSAEEKVRSAATAETDKAFAERDKEIRECRAELAKLKADSERQRAASSKSINWLYLCLFLFCIAVTGLAIFVGWAKKLKSRLNTTSVKLLAEFSLAAV